MLLVIIFVLVNLFILWTMLRCASIADNSFYEKKNKWFSNLL